MLLAFQNVLAHGASVANRNFELYHKQRDQPHFRVGISVGKMLGHTAVMRNQIKRYIRQSLLELCPAIAPQTAFLVIARCSANQLAMAATCCNQLHVMRLAGIQHVHIEVISPCSDLQRDYLSKIVNSNACSSLSACSV